MTKLETKPLKRQVEIMNRIIVLELTDKFVKFREKGARNGERILSWETAFKAATSTRCF